MGGLHNLQTPHEFGHNMTQLSKYFTLEELIFSQTASRKNLDNNPTPEILENLKFLAEQMDRVREILGHPIHVSSGYRSPEVNKAAGSKSTKSQHTQGLAMDFTCPGFGNPKKIVQAIINSGIEYDQVIHEFNSWVHISFVRKNARKQALVIDSSGTRFFA